MLLMVLQEQNVKYDRPKISNENHDVLCKIWDVTSSLPITNNLSCEGFFYGTGDNVGGRGMVRTKIPKCASLLPATCDLL